MGNKFVVNGKVIELTEDVLNAMRTIVGAIESTEHKLEIKKEKEDTDLHAGDVFYFPDPGAEPISIEEDTSEYYRNLEPFESKNKNTLERAAKWIELQNYADQVNESGCIAYWCIFYVISSGKLHIGVSESSITSHAYFSSKEVAQKAIKHFGEDFFKDLILRK